MGNGRKMLAITLAIPIVAFVVAVGVLGKFEGDWQSVLAQQYPGAGPAQRHALTLGIACQDPEMAQLEPCKDLHRVELLRSGTVVAGLLGLALCGGIVFAGRAGQNDRGMLLKLFRPGLYLTIFGLVALITLQAALAVVALYYGESALTGYFHPKLIFFIGLGAALGVIALIRGSLTVLHPPTIRLVGKRVTRDAEPALWRFVDDLARQVETASPQAIVVGLEDNFLVTEADVTCLDGESHGRTLYLSLPLCRILDIDEFKAIVVHELAHFHGLDTEFSKKFYPIHRGASESLRELQSRVGKNVSSLALFPAVVILSFFLESFALAENAISRERELAADAMAASLTGRHSLATGLVKVHSLNGIWPSLVQMMQAALAEGKQFTNLSTVYGHIASQALVQDHSALSDLEREQVSHPTDSHPTLGVRLAAVGCTMTQVVNDVTLPQRPASTLVPDRESLEEALTDAWHGVVYHLNQASMTGGAKPNATTASG